MGKQEPCCPQEVPRGSNLWRRVWNIETPMTLICAYCHYAVSMLKPSTLRFYFYSFHSLWMGNGKSKTLESFIPTGLTHTQIIMINLVQNTKINVLSTGKWINGWLIVPMSLVESFLNYLGPFLDSSLFYYFVCLFMHWPQTAVRL